MASQQLDQDCGYDGDDDRYRNARPKGGRNVDDDAPQAVGTNNTRPCIREARGDGLLSWVTSHNFRKTVATVLDEADHSGRKVADQIGHSKVSMTQDVYLGRKVANPQAAEDLERFLSAEHSSENENDQQRTTREDRREGRMPLTCAWVRHQGLEPRTH